MANNQTAYPPIPRWRFWLNRYGTGFIFKSKRSDWNNVQMCFRFHAVEWGIHKWGWRLENHRHFPIAAKSWHFGLGKSWCIDLHWWAIGRSV